MRQLPHLVVVIDEFRMLVEQAPAALTELMRIAAIGRSLGIHLIMATQRPQGALTADIRANVTTSIALRVQSDMESMDIINAAAASAISLHTPGRAFLARGTEEPEEFQAASLSEPTDRSTPGRLRVRLASESLKDPTGKLPAADDHEDLTPAMAAAPLVEMMSRPLGQHGWAAGKATRGCAAPARPGTPGGARCRRDRPLVRAREREPTRVGHKPRNDGPA